MTKPIVQRIALGAVGASKRSQWPAASPLRPLACSRAFHYSRSFQADNEKRDSKADFKESFQGQLYGSTSRRLAHERQEEARFAREMENRNPQPVMRTIVLSVGK